MTAASSPAPGAAWNAPKHLPAFFDVPDTPPPCRIRIRPGLSPVGLCLAVIRSAGWNAVAGCLLLVAFNAATTLVPAALGAAVDDGIGPLTRGTSPSEALGTFLGWVAVIAGLYAVIHVAYRFGGRLGWYAVQRARHELASRVVERTVDPRGAAGAPRMPGRTLSIATSDTDRACSALYLAIYPLGNLVAVVVATVALFAIHPQLGLLSTLAALLRLGAMALVSRPLHARIGREQEAMADAAGAAADMVEGSRVLRGIHAHSAASAQYRRVSRAARRRAVASNSAEAVVIGANTVLTGLFAGAVTVTAAVLAFRGEISLGGLIAAAALAQSILSSLTELIERAATVGALALASARRVLDVLDAEPHPDARGETFVSPDPHLCISAGSQSIALFVAPGEFVAIDPTLIDDTALVAALTLTADPSLPRTVTVTINGTPITQHDADSLRRTVIVAPHRADLLGTAVLDSVRLAVPDADQRASAALQTARCEELEQELPQGYDTAVHDRGRTLSGGQRQRVALARAIAFDPDVLVLHDPVNAVDAVTESEIVVRVRAARRGRTTIVLTSSSAFHAVADRSVTA